MKYLLIGCTAVIDGYVMVSQNKNHLGRISGIRLVDWTEQSLLWSGIETHTGTFGLGTKNAETACDV